jgi:hypothetical protein
VSAPTLSVYLGFGSNWRTLDAAITWTDVTAYVRDEDGLSVRRGRSTELDDYRAGTCSFTLRNSSRRFDPTYAAGAYYGDLKPGVPVKVTGTANGTEYPVFRGFVEGWPQDYAQGNTMSVVHVTATDGFAKLAMAGTRESTLADAIERLSPTRWYPLSDATGSETAADMGSTPSTGVATAVTFGDDTLDGQATSAEFGAGSEVVITTDLLAPTSAFKTLLFVMQTTASTATIYRDSYPAAVGNTVTLNTTQLSVGHLAGSSLLIGTSALFRDGDPHLIVACHVPGSECLDVDGVDVRTSTFPVGGGVTATPSEASPSIGSSYVGGLAHFAYIDAAVTAAQRTALYEAFTRYDGDTSGERVGRLLTLAGWPTDLRALATGYTTMGPASLGANVLTLCKRVEAAEAGRLFVSRDGKVTLLDRYYHQTIAAGSTSQATFTDTGASNPYATAGFDYDTRMVLNKVRASRRGGAAIEVTDSSSVDDYGEQVDTALSELDLPSDAAVRSLAEYRLDRYAEPAMRARPIGLPLHGMTDAQQADVLDIELGYRVTLERTPQGVAPAITQETVVEGITHSVGGKGWSTTLHLSPVDTRAHAVWGTSLWDNTAAVWGY